MHLTRLPKPLWRLVSLGCVATALASTACIDTTGTLPPSATIKFINASPIAADTLVNLYVNGTVASAQAQPFFTGSTLFTGAVSTATPLSVKSALDTTMTLATGTFPLALDSSYNIIFAATLSGSTIGGGTFDGGRTLVYLPDTVHQSTTNARFQLLHTAARYGDAVATRDVDVYLVSRTDTAINHGTKLNTLPVPYLGVMPFVNFPGVAGDSALRQLSVVRHGDGSTIATLDSVSIRPGLATTFILGDKVNSVAALVYHLDVFQPLQ